MCGPIKAQHNMPADLTMPTFSQNSMLHRWLQFMSFSPRPRRRGERWKPCRSGQGQRQRQSRGWQRGRRRSSWLRERKYESSVELWERRNFQMRLGGRVVQPKSLARFELQGQRSSFAPGLFTLCFVCPSSVYASFRSYEPAPTRILIVLVLIIRRTM